VFLSKKAPPLAGLFHWPEKITKKPALERTGD